ncbi:hypothetical protein GOP47_0022573 [Adiantum capillus-veneris]|uniref:Uncharacterized protein n=1 Tax=Adiantum capillus-veneris TaxID=13818 RepID=A0A9D4Z5G5_ADICA|nr:hypothetical protein GOP47_0022573 [Adiantum capillus-veneris]
MTQETQASDFQQPQEHTHGQEDPSNLLGRVPASPQEPFYVPGYEPSAPPLEPLLHNGEKLGYDEHFHEPHHHKPSRLPPGTRLVDILGAAIGRFWRTSHTILRLELRRAIDLDGPIVRGHDSESPRAQYMRNRAHRTRSYPEDWVDGGPSSSWFQGIHGGGARLKLMQIWEFPDKETGLPGLPWNLNFGLGATLETERGGRLELETRIKAKHLALYILPLPFLEFRGKWPITGTRLAVDARYRIPLHDLEKIWESPTAQLCVSLYNPVGTGFHLSPGGLEFDEHVVNIGQHTKLRVAASIEFPRQFPLEEGEQPIRVHINRLGIKSRIS